MKQEVLKMSVYEIITLAKEKYPLSVQGRFRFSEEEMDKLNAECDIRCSSVYMDGTGYYCIRYRKDDR